MVYLLHEFLSPIANQRDDAYGGSFENRSRFLIETLAAVRKVWPENRPLSARLGVIEYDGRDEETLAESIELIRQFRARGLDFVPLINEDYHLVCLKEALDEAPVAALRALLG